MLPISILVKTDNSILYEIPAGKPNPNQKCLLGEDTRDRVIQAAYKGNTCWYYTLNFIRLRIGKNPCQELSKEREIEKVCSLRRKAITEHENSLPAIADQLQTNLGWETLSNIDLEKAKLFIENRETFQPIFETPETLEGCPSLFPFIEEFLKEGKCNNMHEFLLRKKFKTWNDINIKFLSGFNLSYKKLFSEMNREYGSEETWEELDIIEKAAILDFFARDVSAKEYSLKKISWTPLKGIESLIDELKKKGPLFIGGAFGKTAYVDEPFKMNKKLVGRDIYAWKPGAERHPIAFLGHSVLLIGAKKIEDSAFVYFIDPIDQSDPNDKSSQKIYMISFTNLTSNICDLKGVRRKDSSVPYGYYGNFKI
jgi:hypothetical protein